MFENRKQIKNVITFFSKPYDMLNDNRIKFIFSIGMPLFIMIFLWIFGPFGIALFQDIVKLKLLSSISIAGAIIIIIHVYLLQNIVIKKNTIGTTVIWVTWMTFLIGLCNFIIYMAFFNNFHLIWKGLPNMLYQTFLIGMLPILFIIILYNTYYLKNRIRVINQINSNLTKYQSTIQTKSDLTLMSLNLREVVSLDSDSLLYIASAENYVELYWLENGRTKKILLRKTLTEIEKEVKKKFHHIERCHNSYIVNINQIKAISGNTGGYRIILNKIDFEIPISKKYRISFLKLLKNNPL